MFDIVGFIREKIFRRKKLTQELAGEELSEKQTTKLGYFLLYCMFGAIILSAQWTLSTIKDIPEKPTSVPYCINNIISSLATENNYNNYNYYGNYGYNDCQITSTNPEFDFNPEYTNIQTPYIEIIELNKSITNLESKKNTLEYSERTKQQDYNTSLTEKIAGENSGLYYKNDIKQDIQNNRLEITNINSEIDLLKSKIEDIKLQYKTEILKIKQKFDKANQDYRNSYLLYKFYVAILSFLFSIIVFTVLYRIYVKQKIKNSPHTIIFSIATFAYGLVVLQIAVLFVWDIIPHKLLEIIINLFSLFTPLLYIVQFLWPILIIAIFGFLVYKIQKRLYSPKNILKRFITDKKCPSCGNGVDFKKPFCPLCSHEIQIHCPNCHELTLKGMPYCSNCGSKLPEKDIISHKDNDIFDEKLLQTLKEININEYKGVNFIQKNGETFSSNRENIVKVAIFMINKLGKNKFEPNEFSPYLKELIKHIKQDKIKKDELDRVLGKIKNWVENGGEVILLKK